METATHPTPKIRFLNPAYPVLYCRYPGELKRQPCEVWLRLDDGRMTAGFAAALGGGMPADQWHGVTRGYAIPCLKSEAANRLLEELRPLAERVLAGGEVVWDGSNMVGRLNADATAAEEEIAALCGRWEEDTDAHLNVWEAEDYYAGNGSVRSLAEQLGIAATTTDEELASLAEREAGEARENGIDLVVGLLTHLEKLRDELAEEAGDE